MFVKISKYILIHPNGAQEGGGLSVDNGDSLVLVSKCLLQ
jgi:hypothetical protein